MNSTLTMLFLLKGMINLFPYKTGDIVRVHHYPFTSKNEQDKLRKESNENSSNKINEGKSRYGVVINSGGKNITTIPIMPITSHSGKTNSESYRLRDDEVRLPDNIFYEKTTGKINIYGVIKTERIESFESDEITPPLTKIPLRTKLDLIERYESIIKNGFHKNILDKGSSQHKDIMDQFKDSVLAEKLNFLVTDNGVRKFDSMKNSTLSLVGIQPLIKTGRNKSISVYSVKLKGEVDSFTYTIGTLKSEKKVIKEWSNPKKAKEWLSEDIKYNILKSNIDKSLKPDPLSNSNEYKTIDEFSKDIKKEIGLKKGLDL